MENNLQIVQSLLVNLTILAPLATAVTEVVKRLFNAGSRWLPAISLAAGVGFGLLLLGLSVPAGVVGAIAGLAGTGLWEVGKTTVAGQE